MRGHAGEELDERVVEERRAHLERGEHARAVDLREDVVRQVRLRVEVDELRHPVACPLGAVEGPEAGERIDGRRLDEQRPLLGRREGAEPELVPRRGRLDRAAQEALELEVEAEVVVETGRRSASGTTTRSWRPRGTA